MTQNIGVNKMFVNPKPYVNGVDDDGYKAISVEVSADKCRGFQGNPLVSTEDNYMKRETYEIPTMIDPGDPSKNREIWHMYPGVYEFSSDVYINVPDGHVAFLKPTADLFNGGVTVESLILEPGYKGLVSGHLTVGGGELFLQPGQPVCELFMQKIESA
jgi:deoxycytidine triphosphate deaminase